MATDHGPPPPPGPGPDHHHVAPETDMSAGAPSAATTETTPLLPPAAEDDDRPGLSRPTTDAGVAPLLGPLRVSAVACSLWLLIFLQSSNMSGITMIQGSIAEDLDAYEATMWFTSGYLITMSSLAPLVGKLAAVFSPRGLVVPAAGLLAVGSALSASAPALGPFVLGRVVAGAGGAGVFTLAIILILDLTDKKSRGLVLGLVNASFSMGVSLGGVVYGALLPVVGWRAMFWIQSPISVVSGVALYCSLPAGSVAAAAKTPLLPAKPGSDAPSMSVWQKLRRIDYLGAALLVMTIVFFLYGLSGKIRPAFLLASLASLAAFVSVESLVAPDPVIPLSVLRSRAVLLSCASQLGLMSARWTVLYYMPIFVLAVLGEPRARAGALLIPTNLGFALGGTAVGALHIRRAGSFWLPCLVSLAAFALSMWLLSALARPAVTLGPLIVAVVVGGFATGAALNYTLAHLLHHTRRGEEYFSTSLLGTFRGFGGAFGTSLGGGVFARILQANLTDGFLSLDGGDSLSPARMKLISRLMGAPELVHGAGLPADDTRVAVDAYAGASRGVWQAAAALGLVVLVLQAGTGWKGHSSKEAEEDDDDRIDRTTARANAMENEGVGEV